MKTKRILSVVMLAMLLLALSVGLAAADSGSGDPPPSKVTAYATYTFYNGLITTSGVINTDSPLRAVGLDASKAVFWANADVFVTADVSGTATITVTPQFSNDAANWASGYWNTVSGSTVTAQPYRVIFNSTGSNYLRVPMVGEYIRFRIESSASVTRTVIATVRVTFKNN
jgi:hypothetical protein